jgi:predicted RNase H-like HicB family nuclease
MPKAKQRPKKSTAKKKRTYLFPVLIEKDEEAYVASCPALDGCVTQGDTYEEALANVKEAIELLLECLRDDGEPIPESGTISLTTVEVHG